MGWEMTEIWENCDENSKVMVFINNQYINTVEHVDTFGYISSYLGHFPSHFHQDFCKLLVFYVAIFLPFLIIFTATGSGILPWTLSCGRNTFIILANWFQTFWPMVLNLKPMAHDAAILLWLKLPDQPRPVVFYMGPCPAAQILSKILRIYFGYSWHVISISS